MINCDFDSCIERRGTDSIKWNHYDPDVLPLWVADMDFAAPQPVIQALQERVAHGVLGYAEPQPELYQVIQQRLYERYGWTVDRPDILFLPGVVVGFNMAAHAIGQPGDGILIQPPVYYPFLSVPRNTCREGQLVQVHQVNGRYKIDFDEFEGAINERTRLFILCNPHNPVGRVYERAELEQLAEICLRHHVVICSDEIHCDLIFEGHRHIPIASLSPEIAQNAITLMAPSKTFNIPGLGCSFAIIQNPALKAAFLAVRQGVVSGVNLLGYTAALAAYRDGQAWLEHALTYLQANRDWLRQYVYENLPGVQMVQAEGTYLAWLDFRRTPITDRPAQFLLEHARVGLNEGASFGPGGEGFCRLNFACPRDTLVAALERIQDAYKQVNRK